MKNLLRNLGLGAAEYTSKAASVPAGVMAAGSEGGLGSKVARGYTKLATELPDKAYAAENLVDASQDYNSMTASEFTEKYGESAMQMAGEAMQEMGQYMQNFMENPTESTAAALVTGATLYGAGKVAKFARTKGQGGPIQRLERKLGDKIWGDKAKE